MSVVDSFSDTDPPGYRIDLIDDGTVHISGVGLDETLPAEHARSAEEWYRQNAFAFLPLPIQVATFVDAARSAGRVLAQVPSKALSSAADETEVSAFACAVAEALIAAAAASAPLGIGTDLIGLGATLTADAVRAQPAAEGALPAVWNGLDQAIDFFSLAEHAQQDRAVRDDTRSQLQAFAAQAGQVGDATKALLHL